MISLLILLVLVGVALYCVGMIPMDPKILQLVRAVVILIAVLYVLAWLFPSYVHLPR